MLHHILVKWNDQVADKLAMADRVRAVFAPAGSVPGVRRAMIKPNVVDRPNRYDLLIVLDMVPEALTAWDESDIHKNWKADFSSLIEKKAIFDCD